MVQSLNQPKEGQFIASLISTSVLSCVEMIAQGCFNDQFAFTTVNLDQTTQLKLVISCVYIVTYHIQWCMNYISVHCIVFKSNKIVLLF